MFENATVGVRDEFSEIIKREFTHEKYYNHLKYTITCGL